MKKPTYSKKKNKKGRATLISTTSDNIPTVTHYESCATISTSHAWELITKVDY